MILQWYKKTIKFKHFKYVNITIPILTIPSTEPAAGVWADPHDWYPAQDPLYSQGHHAGSTGYVTIATASIVTANHMACLALSFYIYFFIRIWI